MMAVLCIVWIGLVHGGGDFWYLHGYILGGETYIFVF
jgi:hypothetical protein